LKLVGFVGERQSDLGFDVERHLRLSGKAAHALHHVAAVDDGFPVDIVTGENGDVVARCPLHDDAEMVAYRKHCPSIMRWGAAAAMRKMAGTIPLVKRSF
jgi:hypothetical protein